MKNEFKPYYSFSIYALVKFYLVITLQVGYSAPAESGILADLGLSTAEVRN